MHSSLVAFYLISGRVVFGGKQREEKRRKSDALPFHTYTINPFEIYHRYLGCIYFPNYELSDDYSQNSEIFAVGRGVPDGVSKGPRHSPRLKKHLKGAWVKNFSAKKRFIFLLMCTRLQKFLATLLAEGRNER
jgi:hypothetical protein